MERLADKMLDIINDQDFCFTKEEMRTVEKAMGRLAAYEDTMPLERAQELVKAEKDGRLVAHGQWNENGGGIILCSKCGYGYNLIGRYTHYCPNCGAKMDLLEAALKKMEEADM